MKKTSLLRIIMIICVVWISFGLGAVAMLLFHMAPEIIPHTKTDFASYEEFREATFDYFPDQLPDSAREIRYYTYVGKMDNISAIAFVVDEQDYVLVSDRYKAFFFDYDSRYENQVCTNQFVQDQQLLF